MSEITYKELAEKYARREQFRNVTAVISGVVSVAAGLAALRALRAERRALQAAGRSTS